MSADTPAVRVERVLSDTHTVLVSLDPAQVVDALAWALQRHHDEIRLVRVLPPEHPTRDAARTALIGALSGIALQVTLDPDEAEALAEDITEAAREAAPCVLGCGQLADADFCGHCLDGGAGTVRRAV